MRLAAPRSSCPRVRLATQRRLLASCQKQQQQCSSNASAVPEPVDLWQLAFWSDASTWRRAAANTTRCLIGCSLGDLTALSLLQDYTSWGVALTVPLSCAAGIATSLALETVVLRYTERLAWRLAARTAAGMSLISMVAMELSENAVEVCTAMHMCTAMRHAVPMACAARKRCMMEPLHTGP